MPGEINCKNYKKISIIFRFDEKYKNISVCYFITFSVNKLDLLHQFLTIINGTFDKIFHQRKLHIYYLIIFISYSLSLKINYLPIRENLFYF